MAGLRFVNGRGVNRRLDDLSMECNRQELPFPLDDERCRYFTGVGTVRGDAPVIDPDGSVVTTSTLMDLVGLCTVAFGKNVLYGIVAPDSELEPAAWFTADIAEVEVTSEGTEGGFRKRPKIVQLGHELWRVKLAGVSALYVGSNGVPRNYQTGQSRKLVELFD
jgi:hypothetical protein